MKRSVALAPLSRDHQHALDAALRLRRADDSSVGDAVARFLRFFEQEGRRHFEIEEQLVLPALPAGDPDWAAGIARVLEDHQAIRQAADELATRADVAAAGALGQRLTDHVRFEERQLFPLLEERLADDELGQLAEAVAEAEAGPWAV